MRLNLNPSCSLELHSLKHKCDHSISHTHTRKGEKNILQEHDIKHTDKKSLIFEVMHSTMSAAVLYLHIFCLQMTCGLKELLLNGQSQEPAVGLFPRLFSCLTVRVGASVGVSTGKQNNKHAAFVHVAGWVNIIAPKIL